MARLGSLVNVMMDNAVAAKQPVPRVGDGATHVMWTDRHAYTVIEVSASGKTVKVQRDKATRTDGRGMTDAQSYKYEPDPQGAVRTVRLTKRGWRSNGEAVLMGVRDEYYDYSF